MELLERCEVPLIETKASDTPGMFSGYGAVFGNTDGQGDVIQRGAFASTLKDWRGRGKWPPMLLQHGGGMFGGGADDMLPVGQWMDMEENARGLKVEGQLFGLGTERGTYIYEGLKAGVLDGLSIGFKTIEAEPGGRDVERVLTAIDLWEVSIVTFPANPKARVTAVKALTWETLRAIEDHLRLDLEETGFSQRDAKRVVRSIRKYFHRDGGEPVHEHRDGAAAASDEVGQLLETLQRQADAALAHALRAHITHTAGGSG